MSKTNYKMNDQLTGSKGGNSSVNRLNQNSSSLDSKFGSNLDAKNQFPDNVNPVTQLAYQQTPNQNQNGGNNGASKPTSKTENKTGLPDDLKSGIEDLSGYSMDDVKVHYNSSKPAQLQALAYAQGTDIHVGAGQEQHLPHEAWHVVQQKQGRVKPTRQMKSKIDINDDPALEKEADIMGAKALNGSFAPVDNSSKGQAISNVPIQRRVGMEYETNVDVRTEDDQAIGYHVELFKANSGKWKIEADSSAIEFVTEPFETNDEGKLGLLEAVHEITQWARSIENAASNRGGDEGPILVEDVAPKLGTAGTVDDKKVKIIGDAITSAAIQSAPQATGGVTLEKLPMLYELALREILPHLQKGTHGYEAPWKIEPPAIEKPTIESVRKEFEGNDDDSELLMELEEFAIDVTENKTEVEEGGDKEKNEFNEEEYFQEVLIEKLENYELLWGAFHSQEKPLKDVGIDPDDAPYSMSGMNSVDQPSLFHAHNLAEKAVKKLLKDNDLNFKKLQGLLTLIFNYMIVGASQDKTYSYSKQIAPIMSRTNIKTLYEQLEEHEKEVFTPEFVLEALKMDDGELFAKGFGDENDPSEGISREDWIKSIIEGTPNGRIELKNGTFANISLAKSHVEDATGMGVKMKKDNYQADLLSFDSRSMVVRNYDLDAKIGSIKTKGASSSMGEQNQMDEDADTKEKLAVMELRRLPKNQGIDDWVPTAEVVFDIFHHIKTAKLDD